MSWVTRFKDGDVLSLQRGNKLVDEINESFHVHESREKYLNEKIEESRREIAALAERLHRQIVFAGIGLWLVLVGLCLLVFFR